MKKSEKYLNQYPFEDLLPELDEEKVEQIVSHCDYTIESDEICRIDNIDNFVSTADAVVFYKMGYEAAQQRLENILIAIE